MPYRGDTENHWLLYYTSLYLMARTLARTWMAGEWYTGKIVAGEPSARPRGWIKSWVRLTTTRGQGEYDSPHYMGLFFLSMSYLYGMVRRSGHEEARRDDAGLPDCRLCG